MKETEKLEKLTAFLKADIESKRRCAEIFAKSEDYETANRFKMSANAYQTILWMLEDEEFLQKQWEIFYENMEK